MSLFDEQIVVVFDTLSLENEQKQFEDEVLVLEEQKKAAQTFIISVENNENQFVADDSFGYANQLNALFAEQESIQYITQQATDLSEINQEAYKKTEATDSRRLRSFGVLQEGCRQVWHITCGCRQHRYGQQGALRQVGALPEAACRCDEQELQAL